MARGKAVTKRGKCLACGAEVRWKCVPSAEKAAKGISPHELWNWNGTDYSSRHSCNGFRQGDSYSLETKETAVEADNRLARAQAQADATEIKSKSISSDNLDAMLALAVEAAQSKVRSEVVAVLDSYGIKQETVITVKRGDKVIGSLDNEVSHPALGDVIRILASGRSAYVWGPAGSGKTYGACQAAKALGLEAIVATMPGITGGKLMGFTDAGGREVQTAFVRAFTEGHVFVADEFDRMIPSVASALNSVLAQRRLTIGNRTMEAHSSFGFIATGNTAMRGGTRQYTAAQPLDLATAARFAFVEWTYDDATETQLVTNILGAAKAALLLNWTRAVREALAADQVDTVWCGPRESQEIANALVTGFSLRTAVNMWIWRGYPADAVSRYHRACPLPEGL